MGLVTSSTTLKGLGRATLKLSFNAALCLLFSNTTLAQVQTAGEKFQNVTELHDMPADHMGKVMNLMSASLGVNCQFCHAGNDFAKEDVAHKSVSREMIAMTLKLNADHFHGRTVITCNTCHRGRPKPDSELDFSSLALGKHEAAPDKPGEGRKLLAPQSSQSRADAAPSEQSTRTAEAAVDQVLARYVESIGGASRVAAIASRKITAERLEPSGRTEPEELWQARGGKAKLVTWYGELAIVEATDGNLAWKLVGKDEIQLKHDEAAQIRTEAAIGLGDLKSAITNLRFDRSVTIHGREIIQLVGNSVEKQSELTERLSFDSVSGFLVRRTSTLNTILGPFAYQVDYLDYQEYDGVKLPTKIEFNMPNISWTRVVRAVENNVEIAPTLFQK